MNFQIVIIAVVILAALGALFGLVLGFAAKVFAVEVDPKEEAVLGCLPGANCGGCGFAGCSGYAAAVAKGAAPVNACAAGGEAVAAQIAEIMGVSAGAMVKQLAQVHCTGCGQNYKQYEYVGLHDCVAASKVPGGGALSCAYGCLGLGSCEKACPFDAIHVIDGVAKVDEEKCKACGKCVDICPRHIIALEPYKTKRHVTIPCSSHDKGVDARKVCDNGCIGCSLCAKSCPKAWTLGRCATTAVSAAPCAPRTAPRKPSPWSTTWLSSTTRSASAAASAPRSAPAS